MKVFAPLRSMHKICSPCLTMLATITLFTLSVKDANAAVGPNFGYSAFANSLVNFTVRGTVVDEQGQPIPGASVLLEGTSNGTVTDAEGKFTLSVPDAGGNIKISYIGYDAIIRAVNQNTGPLSIKLQPSANSLSQVVVTAFATQKRVNVTGAVSTIDAKDLVASPVGNITNALIGNAPGISGLQKSGEPGRNGTKIYVRGLSTYSGSSDPLIVIDGIEQPAERPYEQLNGIDANEIENVSILKDAASTAVYGIRAANGVIIVTTKRGTTGKPMIGFSTNFGATNAIDLTTSASSYDYAVSRNRAIRSNNKNLNDPNNNAYVFTDDELWKFQNNRDYTPAEVAGFSFMTADQKAALNNAPALYYGSHDYYTDQFDNTGTQQQYNLNIRGGSEKVKYYTSVGYFNQGSILENYQLEGSHSGSNFNRANFRSNFDIQPLKNTTISINVAGQFGAIEGPAFGTNPFDDNTRYKQMMQYLQEGNVFIVRGIIDGKLITGIQNPTGGVSPSNPLDIKQTALATSESILLQGDKGIYNTTLLIGSIKVDHKLDYLTKGLSIRATANYDDSFGKFITIGSTIPSYKVRRNPANLNELQFFGGNIPPVSFNGTSYSKTYNKLYFDAGINYEKAIGGSSFTALVLGKANRYTLPADGFNTPSGIMGLVGRLTYNYKEKYQAEFNLGYNGTENFAEGRRFGFFPAYSLGWVPSSESFFPKNKIITFLKFRGSYGELGNDQLGARRYLFLPNTYNLNQGSYYFGTSNGTDLLPRYNITTEGTLGNPMVTWERSKKTDIGMEAKFFSNKLSMVLDLFKEERDNILGTLGVIPATFGVSAGNIPPVNIGVTQNKGYELSLGWRDKVGEFSYGLNGSVSYTKNKVIFRSEAPFANEWQNATGAPIGQYFGLTSDGFFNTAEELASRPYNTFGSNKNTLGDIRYKDLNGDNMIDEQDVSRIGYSNLPQYAFNSRLNFGYKGFDLSVLFNGTAKGSFYVPQNMVGTFFKVNGNVYQWQVDGEWTPERAASGAKITYPRMEINTTTASSNFVKSDFWLRSSDFIKLKNIEVGYSLRNLNLMKTLKISSLRIYANGNNLFTFKNDLKVFGLDPETSDYTNQGAFNVNNQGYFFPLTRVYNFGINVQF